VWVYAHGDDPTIVIIALSLVLAGAGQFIAALRIPGGYGVAFGWAAGSMVFLANPLLEIVMDGYLGMEVAEKVLGMHSLSLPGVTLGLAFGLLMAVLSLVSAVVPPRKKTAALLWAALVGLGCIAGFAVGDACVTTRCTLVPVVPVGDPPRWVFQGDPSRGNTQVRVEVYVLGKRVSDEVGGAGATRVTPRTRREAEKGLTREEEVRRELRYLRYVRSVSPAQDAWVYRPLAAGAAAGAAAGLVVGWVIARRLGRRSGEGEARRTTP
jgi:hypothetical protein